MLIKSRGIYCRYLKRILDIFFALIFLPIVIFCILFLGMWIYFEDRGPIFYNAYRIGRYGKAFKMFKLRTMIVNAPDIRLADGYTYNGDDDTRITQVGHILRKTSIDELPQIINVLLGNMSFIGPRPDTVDWLDRYSEEERSILTIRPGITGYSQAYFRNSVDGVTKLKNDIYYIENESFILDIKILFKTIKTVFLHQNINVDQSRLKN